MLNEDTKRAINVMNAWCEGRVIQYKTRDGEWEDYGSIDDNTIAPSWNWVEIDYRIKPEPRTFWLVEEAECWYPTKREAENFKAFCGVDYKIVKVVEVLE